MGYDRRTVQMTISLKTSNLEGKNALLLAQSEISKHNNFVATSLVRLSIVAISDTAW